jgi:histidinol-phosphate aminotransferase
MAIRTKSHTVRPAHPYLDGLEPYVPPDLGAAAAGSGLSRAELLRLAGNENQYGPSPRVAQALAGHAEYQYYPDYTPLKVSLARYAGVAADQVVLSNGADEMIDLLIRLFAEPGQGVVVCPPTFDMYAFFAHVNRCRVVTVPRLADFSLDVGGIERAVGERDGRARLVFVASPGNPHGLVTPLQVLERLLALPVVVAVDEAYVEFGGQSAVSLLDSHSNLVVVRTLSKWAGLAGLRLGYALLDSRYASSIERIRAPYNVNAAAVVAALATLEDLGLVEDNVRALIGERERLRSALRGFAWLHPLRGCGNFVFCEVTDGDGRGVADALARRGILIQAFRHPRLAAYVRITAGRPEQTDAVIEAFRDMDRARREAGK